LDPVDKQNKLWSVLLICCSICLFPELAVAWEMDSEVPPPPEPETPPTEEKDANARPNLVSLYMGGFGVVGLLGVTTTEDDVVHYFPGLTLGYERKLVRWLSVGAILSWHGYHPGWVNTMRVSGSLRGILPLFGDVLELYLGGRFGLTLNIFKDDWTEGAPWTAKAGFGVMGLVGFRVYIRNVFIGAEACSGIDIIRRPEFGENGENDEMTTVIEASGGVGYQF